MLVVNSKTLFILHSTQYQIDFTDFSQLSFPMFTIELLAVSVQIFLQGAKQFWPKN